MEEKVFDATNKESQIAEEPETKKAETARKLLVKISLQAHHYNKENTKTLSSLLEPDDDNLIDWGKIAPCEERSDVSLYSAERDYVRFRDGEAKADAGLIVPFAKDYARIIHSPSFRRLQGKSQLIPAGENEFFRTRLTHSLEVADIAVRIARNINYTHPYFQENNLNLELLTCSCLLHDIGHPPFGHSGEEVLNQLMGEWGGFEGNAQTLRLVSSLENRLGGDTEVGNAYKNPRGLNLTARTLASIIKYDQLLEPTQNEKGKYEVRKGYYETEKKIVEFIKKQLKVESGQRLKTVECQIMDIADDISYSAYDLEDTMEAGIVHPLDLMSQHDDDLEKITKDVNEQFKKRYPLAEPVSKQIVLKNLIKVFESTLLFADESEYEEMAKKGNLTSPTVPDERTVFVGRVYGELILHAKNPLIRRQFLETLIQRNIDAVRVCLNKEQPFLSKIEINPDRLMLLECLKAFNFHKVITTKKIQTGQYRSEHILNYIFDALDKDIERGYLLTDEQKRYLRHTESEAERKRFVCDIIASLSDHEAVQLFNKLNGNGKFFGYI